MKKIYTMPRLLKMIFAFIMLATSLSSYADERIDSVLQALDYAISNSEIYEQAKVNRIEIIKRDLSRPNLSDEMRYEINKRLYEEYEYYICDSANLYIDRNIAIAEALNRPDLLSISKISKARILSTSGLFAESFDLIKTIDKSHLSPEQLMEYYRTIEDNFIYHAEYAQGSEYALQYEKKVEIYRDSMLNVGTEDAFWHTISAAKKHINNRETDQAEKMLIARLKYHESGTRERAVLLGMLGYTYEVGNKPYERMICLAQSAIADMEGVVKENMSLRQLAEMLYERGDVEHANRYLKKSLADANVFNARLRNMQSSKMLPIIDASYQTIQDEQSDRLRLSLIATSLVSVFLIIALIYIFRLMKSLSNTRDRLIDTNNELHRLNDELTAVNLRQCETNASLREANVIKEEYIGRFLQLCSTYISEMESYRKMLYRKATTGRIDDVSKALKSNTFINDSLREFYQTFDTSFLNIFPHFVEQFNEMLPLDERIELKPGERLNTELRIFALIRLGITDSQKIANFLRCSISTIYTYRSKLKKRSLHHDDFEEQISKISSHGSL